MPRTDGPGVDEVLPGGELTGTILHRWLDRRRTASTTGMWGNMGAARRDHGHVQPEHSVGGHHGLGANVL